MVGKLENKIRTENNIRNILSDLPNSVSDYYYNLSVYSEPKTCEDYIKKIRKFLNLVGTDYMRPTFDLMNANNIFATYDKKKQQVIDILNRVEEMQKQEESSKIKLPINGNDIINELHVKNGKHIGIILDKVRDAYFENPNITKDEAFEIAEATIKALTV